MLHRMIFLRNVYVFNALIYTIASNLTFGSRFCIIGFRLGTPFK